MSVRRATLPRWALVLAAAVCLAAARSACAQAWPDRPLHVVVPFPPGGPSDTMARVLAPRLAARLAQPVLVENRPGASANIGMESVARSAPDGYTVLYGAPTLTLNPHLYKLAFDPLRDLAPVARISTDQFVLVVNTAAPAKSVAQLLEAARARPGAVTCGFSGGIPEMGCRMLASLAGVKITFVRYKGVSQIMQDVAGGRVDMFFDGLQGAAGQSKDGGLRVLARTSAKAGSGALGAVPAMSESVPEFELAGWQGLLVAAGTPGQIIERLAEELAQVLRQPDVRELVANRGSEVSYEPPEAFAAFIRREYDKYGKIIRDSGIRAE